MPEIPLTVETGRPTGSRASGRLRAAGKVPGVVYGHGIDPVPVAVDARALRTALTTEAGLNALLDLKLDGTTYLALAREVQRDPVRGTLVHLDFVVVRRDEVIAADVPVTLTGEATEVHKGDGVVEQQLFSLAVRATPGRIPNAVEVDIGGLAIGDTVRVRDLTLPTGVTTEADPEVPVVVAQPPQVSDEDLVTEAEAEAQAEAAAAEEAAAEEAGPPAGEGGAAGPGAAPSAPAGGAQGGGGGAAPGGGGGG